MSLSRVIKWRSGVDIRKKDEVPHGIGFTGPAQDVVESKSDSQVFLCYHRVPKGRTSLLPLDFLYHLSSSSFFSPSSLPFEFEFLLVLAVDLSIASMWTAKDITRPYKE